MAKAPVRTTEFLNFRLFRMPCCRQEVCWVNPRFPNYCPECGTRIFPLIKTCVLITDSGATLRVATDIMDRLQTQIANPRVTTEGNQWAYVVKYFDPTARCSTVEIWEGANNEDVERIFQQNYPGMVVQNIHPMPVLGKESRI